MSTERTLPCSRKKLLETAKTTLAVILKFLSELSAKGINQLYYNAFDAEITATGALKTDDALRKEAAAQNAISKNKCIKSHKWGMLLKTYLQRAFGKKGTEVNEFPSNFEDLRTDEAGMINTFPQILILAEKYKDALLPKGMNADFIDQGKILFKELDELNTAAKKMEDEHKAYREERHLAHLSLYDKINYVNSIGREIFTDDPVKIKYFQSPWGTGKGTEKSNDEETKITQAGTAAPPEK